MLIAKSTVKNFLQRKLKDYDWIKEATNKELDEALASLDPPPIFHTEPYLHQKAAFYISACLNEFVFLLDLGLGKTKLVLDIIAWRKRAGLPHRTLVLVPNVTNIENWAIEVKTHQPELNALYLLGSTKERAATLEENEDFDLAIINYQGLNYLCTKKVNKGGKGALTIVKSKADKLGKKFDVVIFDESTAIKNHNSLNFKIARRLTKVSAGQYLLTGTPFGRDPSDLWAQFYICDRGETLGDTLGLFRAAFFKTKQNYWTGFDTYVFDTKKEDLLYKVLRNKSIFYGEDECPDLPDRQFYEIKLTLPQEALDFYTQERRVARLGQGNIQVVNESWQKMRMVGSGFIQYIDENDKKHVIEFKENPKLDALEDLIDSMPQTSKMVVFHEFIHTGKMISERLKKRKIQHQRLYSGTRDHAAALRKFRNDPKCRIFVVNNQSGSFGLNLQVANYVVFVESPVSPIVRKQAEKRCHRPGQKHRVFYYDIIMKQTMDDRIKSFIKEGKDLFKALISGEEKW